MRALAISFSFAAQVDLHPHLCSSPWALVLQTENTAAGAGRPGSSLRPQMPPRDQCAHPRFPEVTPILCTPISPMRGVVKAELLAPGRPEVCA